MNQMNKLSKVNKKNKKKNLFPNNKNYNLDLRANILQIQNGEVHNSKISKILNNCQYTHGT